MGGAPRDNQDSLFGVPERLADLIVRDRDGDLSPAELDELGDLLKQSAQARDLYVRWGLQAHVLAEALRPEYDEGQSEGASADLSAMGVVEASEEHYPALLAELNRMEAKAPAIAFPSIPIDAAAEQQDDAGSLSAHDLAAVGRYALRLALTSKPAKRFYAYAGAAAIVLLAAVGLNLWIGSEKKADTPFAGQQQAPQGPPQADVIHVATLTAEHHAQWAEGAFATGSDLRAGQTLTLTHGFAEITTTRGARAILEAPCTIEMIDSSNALRLVSGKLVGICEAESSKGFLVRTPHMDITDLGTRFGVDASAADTTEVHVYEGEIEVDRLSAGHPPQRLINGQAIRVGAKSNQTVQIDADTSVFAVTKPVTIVLPGTGTGLAVGEADPAWTVVSAAGQPLATSQALSVSAATGHIRHMPNDPNRSQWLAWVPEKVPAADQTKYLVRTSVQVPENLDPDSAYLTIHFAVDNHLADILVNGERIEIKIDEPREDWRELERLEIQPRLKPGINTIDFEILNFKPRFDLEGVGLEAGLRVEWQLHAKRKFFTR